jgi:hypothetical protein
MADFAIGMNRPRGMSAEEQKAYLRVIARYGVRMVRFLFVRLSRGHYQPAVFLGHKQDSEICFRHLAFAAGFAVRPFRSSLLQADRRHHRPEVHFSHQNTRHGSVNVPGRTAPELRFRGNRSAGCSHCT